MAEGIVVTGRENIEAVRMLTLRRGLALEIKTGMRLSRGRSCSAIVKEMLGLPRNSSRQAALQKFEAHLAERGIEV